VSWRLVYTKPAKKGREAARLGGAETQGTSSSRTARGGSVPHAAAFEKLVGDLSGACSRRINIQRRLVYQSSTRSSRQGSPALDALRVEVEQRFDPTAQPHYADAGSA